MKPTKPLGEMTDAEFVRYLKRNNITGMGAFSASRKRRGQQAAILRRDAEQIDTDADHGDRHPREVGEMMDRADALRSEADRIDPPACQAS